MPSKTVKTTTAAAVLALGLLASQPAIAANNTSDSQAFTFGVIGDIPYGAAEIAKFPSRIQDINGDRALKFVTHVGDIKNGSSVCSDEYFADIRSQFDTFEHPLVFTPGDNEWVDCHRTNNGAYNPLERLDKLRDVFFDEPGKTLGATMPVKTQEKLGLPENVRFTQNRVAFSVVNVQGSNNSLLPWSGLGETTPTPEQLAEVEHRTDAVLGQIRDTFTDAERRNDRAVVLMTQADMFDPSLLAAAAANPETVSGSGRSLRPSLKRPTALTARSISSTATATSLPRTSRWRKAHHGWRSTASPPRMTCSASPWTDRPTPPTTSGSRWSATAATAMMS
ncbi:hypothetical protein [Pseudarthrobacter raffinosi]|uniref:hypothetical protein n=1 Tax=Pseudarthrobacter raffinosi TaxID=2953651 RepID=UPI00208F43F7|nr:hypothetical protein [Pseudarthrobacter sp. MDT3-9]MCO4252665.1 hypothetical protein [Pseudarthrobacter sp. MDT3-9]